MIQVLDLARENAVLRDEVDRLRRAVAQLGGAGWSLPPEDGSAPTRLVLIMPKCLAWGHGLLADRFAGIPHCEVIVDRRVGERRCSYADPPAVERRRGERRASSGDASPTLVASVVPVEGR